MATTVVRCTAKPDTADEKPVVDDRVVAPPGTLPAPLVWAHP